MSENILVITKGQRGKGWRRAGERKTKTQEETLKDVRYLDYLDCVMVSKM